jgi:serine/threonine protein kinase
MSIDVEPATTKMPGFPRRFGPYVLVKPLARGGMGALYLALRGQAGMDKLCVVKTALPHLADRGYLQRFRDEAKVVVRLSHGNLVTVFDAGEVKSELFLAMDFIEGKDLRAVWNRCAQKGTAFPIAVAVHLIKELARGLAYAHSFEGLSLVHRDVSPPNVLLSYTGEVKLTDFGLATSTLKLEKTAPGVIYGKVSYMSPEQARGEPLDGRTDIYSAGVMLWEMLTGRQLFPPGGRDPAGAESEDDLLERVRRPMITPPSQRTSRVPAELDAICARALDLNPATRYQTGEELRSDLAAFLAKTAPSTDGEQVARFLRDLFGNDIAKERAERETLLDGGRRILGSDKTPAPRPVPKVPVKPPAPGLVNADHVRHGTTPLSTKEEGEHTRRVKEGEISQLAGTILADRYHIKRLCGEGGMGRVYEAEHVEIGKRVAVKVLHPAYTRTPDVVERFRREARAASKIYHPNIVNVTDSGTVGDGSFFFVMEYIEGVELGYVIHREGPLAPARVLHVTAQMCDALQAAHDAGVIHRDLKPENILLVTPANPKSSSSLPKMPLALMMEKEKPPTPTTPQLPLDFVKVLDFGIAKNVDVDEPTSIKRRLTRPGVAMGTPEYMAPEQAAGKAADPRSDIYAVGSIMYEMLTGSPPYDGDNVMEVLHKKANEAPKRIREVRPEVPVAVEALVERAMARLPADRPQTMAALAEEVRGVASNLSMQTPPPVSLPPRHNSPLFAGAIDRAELPTPFGGLPRRGVAAAAAALVVLGAFAIVRTATSKRGTGPAPVARAVRLPPPPVVPPPVEPEPVFVGPRLVEAEPPTEAPRSAARVRPGVLAAAQNRELLKNAQTMLKAQRYEEAGEAFKRLLGGRRERGPALLGLGNIAFQKQNYPEAVARAREATRAGGGIEAYLLLGDAYFKLAKYSDARTAYDDALRLDSGSETAKKRAQAGRDLAMRRM